MWVRKDKMTLRKLLEECMATETELKEAKEKLRKLNQFRYMDAFSYILELDKEIAISQAHRDCVQIMIELIPREILDAEPADYQMGLITKIRIATALLREDIRKKS